MKRLLLSLLLSCYSILMLAQPVPPPPGIFFTSATDGTDDALCPAPQVVDFIIEGGVQGIADEGDTIWINVNFGDGADTNLFTLIDNDNPNNWDLFATSVSHLYQAPGNYSVEYYAEGWFSTNGTPMLWDQTYLSVNEVIIADSCGTVEGTVYVDLNGNCVHDPDEEVLPNLLVGLSANGEWMGGGYTDENGEYHINAPIDQTYEAEVQYYGFTTDCDDVISIPSIPSAGNDFGLYCETDQFDFEGGMNGFGFRPGMIGYLLPYVYNNGCMPQDGQLKVLLDPITTFVTSNPPDVVSWSGDTAIIDFDSLASYSWANEFFQLQLMVDSTAILDSLVCFEMWVCPEDGDADLSNNYVTECFSVVNSYDPNDKQVTPAGVGENGAILPNQTMTYKLRFQNTGTAEAFNVFIMDTIDTDLDMSSFQIVSASHHMEVFFPAEGVVKFNFPDINLPDSTTNEPESHGYVLYRIAQNSDLPEGTVIENTGHIYFDINPPVVTNTTVNTIDLFVEVIDMAELESVQFFPNPASTSVTIVSEFDNAVLSILDLSGRMVASRSLRSGNTEIDISNLTNGSYILRVDSGNRTAMSKLVKMER